MARNRRNPVSGTRLGPGVKAVMLCLFLAGAGVGYVRQKSQIYALGEEYKQCETRLEYLRGKNQERARELEMVQSPRELERRVRRMNLGLIAPEPDQIVRLVEPASGARWHDSQRLLAGQSPP